MEDESKTIDSGNLGTKDNQRKLLEGEFRYGGQHFSKVSDVLSQEAIDVYKLYREKVAHEDTLINFRTSWFVTLQAFLFTSFALSLGKFDADFSQQVPVLFAAVGFAACFTTFVSVLAADKAINKTTQKWKGAHTDGDGNFFDCGVKEAIDPSKMLPAIKGGGANKKIAFWGSLSSLGLPIVVAVFWVYLGLDAWKEIGKDVAQADNSIVEQEDTADPVRSGSDRPNNPLATSP